MPRVIQVILDETGPVNKIYALDGKYLGNIEIPKDVTDKPT